MTTTRVPPADVELLVSSDGEIPASLGRVTSPVEDLGDGLCNALAIAGRLRETMELARDMKLDGDRYGNTPRTFESRERANLLT